MKSKDLTDDQTLALRDWIEANLKVEGDLRREVTADIRRKVEIGCYQGIRHRKGLPVTGSAPTPMRAPARVHARPSPARRRPKRTTRSSLRSSVQNAKGSNRHGPQDGPGAKKVRRKEKKNVAHGHAHIKSTFNNTIVSITDPTGAVIAWASRWSGWLQGQPQVHAVRRAARR